MGWKMQNWKIMDQNGNAGKKRHDRAIFVSMTRHGSNSRFHGSDISIIFGVVREKHTLP